MQIRQYLHRRPGHPAMTLTRPGMSGETSSSQLRTRTGGRSACGMGAHTELTASVQAGCVAWSLTTVSVVTAAYRRWAKNPAMSPASRSGSSAAAK
jgi:hypothetical protein